MTNSSTTQNFFKKVAFSEKKKLLKVLTELQTPLMVKGDMEDFPFHLIPIENQGTDALLCHLTEDSQDVEDAQGILVNFVHEEHRYFMQTKLGFRPGWAVVQTSGDLFQLQRRSSVRIEVPEEIEARFMIRQHKGNAYALNCAVENISVGGLKVRYKGNEPKLSNGDLLKGTLQIGIKRPLDFSMEVRFVGRKLENKEIIQSIGLQFKNIEHSMETHLLGLIMDIQHDIYIKTQKGEIPSE